MHTTFEIQTDGPGLFDFTDAVRRWLPPASGLLTLFIRHTSASLLIQENADPEVQTDLAAFLALAAPRRVIGLEDFPLTVSGKPDLREIARRLGDGP